MQCLYQMSWASLWHFRHRTIRHDVGRMSISGGVGGGRKIESWVLGVGDRGVASVRLGGDGGVERGEDDPRLWKERSPSSWGIVLARLATVAGLLLWREASAKVFTFLGGGDATGGDSGALLRSAVTAAGGVPGSSLQSALTASGVTTASPAAAGEVVAAVPVPAVAGRGWGLGRERFLLLSSHASLRLLSLARLFSLAGRRPCRRVGAGTGAAADVRLRERDSRSIPPRASNTNLTQLQFATHSWYISRRRETAVPEGGGVLPAVEGVAVIP